jgi:hypothetical protein
MKEIVEKKFAEPTWFPLKVREGRQREEREEREETEGSRGEEEGWRGERGCEGLRGGMKGGGGKERGWTEGCRAGRRDKGRDTRKGEEEEERRRKKKGEGGRRRKLLTSTEHPQEGGRGRNTIIHLLGRARDQKTRNHQTRSQIPPSECPGIFFPARAHGPLKKYSRKWFHGGREQREPRRGAPFFGPEGAFGEGEDEHLQPEALEFPSYFVSKRRAREFFFFDFLKKFTQ